ncbi:MAG: hypothetical protein KDJ50_06795 [Alphaproteobacteria bacterium]|nr:hypothetical protein [Alphaproteobacteria bacterium]
MRFEVNIDCTPEEARQFFGLPDLLPLQQELMDIVSNRLSENIQTMEPELLVKTWLPAMFQGWSDMQNHFWNQMTQMGGPMSTKPGAMNFNFNPGTKSEKKDTSAKKKK